MSNFYCRLKFQEEIPRNLEDGDHDEADQEGAGEDDNVDDLDPLCDSDV